MGRYNFAPQRVHQAATRLLEGAGRYERVFPPPWYAVIGNLPPSERLVRPALQPVQRKGRKASRLFRPLKLEYEEDKLRLDFFGDHPWELARPRQILEDDGKDYQRYDWSKLDQTTKQVDGESVVQRQAWLMGLVRHEIDFPASADLLQYLSDNQDALKLAFNNDYSVDLEYNVPSEKFRDLDADVPLTVHLTYHPKYPHDFNDALKHLTSVLSQQGLDTNSVNRRSFTAAFINSETVAEKLQQADLQAVARKYNIAITLEPTTTIRPVAESPFDIQPLKFSYHRNQSDKLPILLSHLSSMLQLKPTDVLSPTMPSADPDTYKPYTKLAAYDKARKEFYEIRHFQDVERRVAREEALWTGAEFGPSPLEVGMAIEDEKYEDWKEWAAKEIMAIKQLSGSSASGGENTNLDFNNDPDIESAADDFVDSVPATKKGQNAQGGALFHP